MCVVCRRGGLHVHVCVCVCEIKLIRSVVSGGKNRLGREIQLAVRQLHDTGQGSARRRVVGVVAHDVPAIRGHNGGPEVDLVVTLLGEALPVQSLAKLPAPASVKQTRQQRDTPPYQGNEGGEMVHRVLLADACVRSGSKHLRRAVSEARRDEGERVRTLTKKLFANLMSSRRSGENRSGSNLSGCV